MSAQLRTLDGGQETFSDETLDQLRAAFHGPLIEPDSPDFDEIRVVQNAMIDRRPGLIARCAGAADVIDAVSLANERDLLVAVRGGGHGIAGHCIADDCLLVDLSAMRGVWVDPDRQVVRVQAGATWGDVDRETQAHGLAVPGGVISTTGVAGLTLGGGIGWLHRKHGLACDNLRSAQVVLANGEPVTASPSENPDLFWAIRGGGGNFGVVTSFEFDAHPLGPTVMMAAPIYAAADAEQVFSAWRGWAREQPEEVTTRALFWTLPNAPALPEAVRGQAVLITAALYAGDPEEGERALEPVRGLARPLADLSGRTSYREAQSDFDPFFPKGEHRSYWKSVFLSDLSDEVLDTVIRRVAERPHPLVLLHVPQLGGIMSEVDARETAFGDRSAPWMLSVDGNWLDEADDDANIAWVKDAVREVEGLSPASGTYLNFHSDPSIGSSERETAFGENLERLAELKSRYDPENRFRLNANIQPTAAA